MAEWELPKLHTAVRFRSPALNSGWMVFALCAFTGCMPYIEAEHPVGGLAVPPAVPGVYHRVERGQTLWRIAKVYGVDLETLAAANRLADAGRLEVGQQVFVPGAAGVRTIPAAGSVVGGPPVESVAGEDFLWPVRGRVITAFGGRTPHGSNKGIDIAAPEGTPVRAVRSGQVAFVDDNLRGFGKTVILDHGEMLSTVYTHLHSIQIAMGQSVRRGDVIGAVGSTGRAMTSFLHFEVRRRHRPDNPFYYLP